MIKNYIQIEKLGYRRFVLNLLFFILFFRVRYKVEGKCLVDIWGFLYFWYDRVVNQVGRWQGYGIEEVISKNEGEIYLEDF